MQFVAMGHLIVPFRAYIRYNLVRQASFGVKKFCNLPYDELC